MKKCILFLAAILFLCSNVATAGIPEDRVEASHGAEAHKEGSYAKAQEILRPLTAKGNAVALSISSNASDNMLSIQTLRNP